MSGQCHAPAALYPWGETPGTHCTGGWVGLRAGVVTEARGKVLCFCWGSNPSSQVYSQEDTILTELPQLCNYVGTWCWISLPQVLAFNPAESSVLFPSLLISRNQQYVTLQAYAGRHPVAWVTKCVMQILVCHVMKYS
jgi:hypothetical protein